MTLRFSDTALKALLLLVLSGIGTFYAKAQSERTLVDKIVGIVGDNVILLSDIELQYQQLALEGGAKPSDKCKMLDQLLLQKLFLYQAEVDSVVVGEDEVENELNRRIRYFIGLIGSEDKLEEYYGKSILEIKDEFRTDIEDQLLSGKMRDKILDGVRVTPSEVKKFFSDIPKDSLPYFDAEVEVGQIVVRPEIRESQKQLALAKIQEIRERVMNGESFNTMAIIYSEDPGSASNGGDLGYFGRGQMVTEFEAAAFSMKEGEVSDVIETKFGYHILKLEERKGNQVKARHILIKPQLTSFDLQEAKEKMDSIRTQLVNGTLTFSEAVNKHSQDENTKHTGGMMVNPQTSNSYFPVDQLDKDTYFAIDKLNPGEYSEVGMYQMPNEDVQAFRVVYLKSESKAHVASLKEDYSKIKSAALTKKENEVMDQWIKDKAQETYIYADNLYNCEELKKWLSTQETQF